jgi:site-specific DNA-methyltransferase (adenine-specific)
MTIESVLSGASRWTIVQGDCLDILRTLPDNSIDSVVTDPPAGIGFMGKEWDADKGGRDQWIVWLSEHMREAMRTVKPGGHALVWSLPRTSHWTGMALENAGWQVRDVIAHLFGSGFPKSLNLGQGWGTALKPAHEDWWLIRKPFKGSIVANVAKYGTGGLNIDGCRVPHVSSADFEAHAAGVAAIKAKGGSMQDSWKNSSDLSGANDVTALGRWPAHLVLSHAPGCEKVGFRKIKAAPSWKELKGLPTNTTSDSSFTGKYTSSVHHSNEDGTETVEEWKCVEGCPVAELDRDENVSRYFSTFVYEPKASREDRELGLGHMPTKSGSAQTGRAEGSAGLTHPRSGAVGNKGGRANVHPTCKSTDLMRWLVRLITPRNGLVLDPFAGSGSTGVACSAECFRFIGVELSEEYAEIARARIRGDAPLFNSF